MKAVVTMEQSDVEAAVKAYLEQRGYEVKGLAFTAECLDTGVPKGLAVLANVEAKHIKPPGPVLRPRSAGGGVEPGTGEKVSE